MWSSPLNQIQRKLYARIDDLPVSARLKVALANQSQMTVGTPLALCPPVTASDCWAAVIVPHWHESPQEIPPTKHPPGRNVGIALVLESLGPGLHRLSWRAHVTQQGMLEANTGGRRWEGGGKMEARWLEDSDGEPPRLAKDLGRGFGASSRGCSANPQLAGWGEVWWPLCWGGRPSLWSALRPFCQTYLKSRGCFPLRLGKGTYQEANWWRGSDNSIFTLD